MRPEGSSQPGGRAGLPAGFSLLEILASVAILAILASISVPLLAETVARERLHAAGLETTLLFRGLRQRAVAQRVSFGLRFTPAASGWDYSLYQDGNGNGIRTADILAGRDPLVEGPRSADALHEGIRFGLPSGAIPQIPPGTGSIPNPGDPVKFGPSDIVSFSPSGTVSSGTLYLTDGRRALGVVAYGPTGRIRVFRYDPAVGVWSGP
ncbi:MAG TPA: prepilin-type N-terminal cleavage/methylation domain-containing protein [Candidatus Polarisedimenticolia bacterium]|nr:prepilin-type N-terminal cleavage/methylation domain-containing protein [Candidatus Polarisedimenticolia bacterium]